MPKPIYVLSGPNLNLLGSREPHIYGSTTLAEIGDRCAAKAREAGYEIVFQQSNHEGVLVDLIQEAQAKGSAVVLNGAGLTHTSVALHDVIKAVDIPVVECHISNPAARESFRHHSYVSLVADGVVMGFGADSYELALDGAIRLLSRRAAAAADKA